MKWCGEALRVQKLRTDVRYQGVVGAGGSGKGRCHPGRQESIMGRH
jgi:hypothetical protein